MAMAFEFMHEDREMKYTKLKCALNKRHDKQKRNIDETKDEYTLKASTERTVTAPMKPALRLSLRGSSPRIC